MASLLKWVYYRSMGSFWTLFSFIDLFSLLLPTPYSFNYCNFIISLGIRQCGSSIFVFLLQNCLAILDPFHFHFFRTSLSISTLSHLTTTQPSKSGSKHRYIITMPSSDPIQVLPIIPIMSWIAKDLVRITYWINCFLESFFSLSLIFMTSGSLLTTMGGLFL